MNEYLPGVMFVLLLALSGFFSASEMAFFSLSPLRLKKMEDDGDRKAAEILKMLADKQKILIVVLFGNTLANIAAAMIALKWFFSAAPERLNDWNACAGLVIAIAASIYLVSEVPPKTLAIFNPLWFAKIAMKPLKLFIFLFAPGTYVILWVLRTIFPRYSEWNRKLGSATSMEEIDSYFSLGEEVGIIEREEKELISSVFEFGDTLVREVMVPRPDIIAAPINILAEDLFEFIREDGHSRFPVYDGSLDRVIGILYVKDLLMRLDEIKQSYELFKLLRPPYFVPETKKLDDLLREFQKRKIHLALVVDEYGGVSGLVTIEDLLEEIVGEIVDEYDLDEQDPLVKIDENTYNVDAKYGIRTLEEELGLKLDYEDSETVGGFVLEKLGRIPKKGESVQDAQAGFYVTEMKGNRILRVKVAKHVVKTEPETIARENDGN